MKALHVVSIEKFLPQLIETCEAVNPGQNCYVVFDMHGKLPYEPHSFSSCLIRNGPQWFDREVREQLERCEALFLHPLNAKSAVAAEAASPDVMVVWCGMGADYYEYSPRYRDRLQLPLTRRATRPNLFRRTRKALRLRTRIARLRGVVRPPEDNDPVRRVAPRVDFFSVLERDHDLARMLPGFRARHLDYFSYYTFERALGMGAEPVDGPDILIGNSASWTNNHFDIFEQLRDLDLEGRRIVLPLNYGDDRCAEAVEHRAVRLFGRERLHVLRGWIPVAEYNQLLSRCGTVFMNHVRGQAMGNISSMLFRGAKVYLREENPYAVFYEGLGLSFGRIGDAPFRASVFAPLTAEEKARNASIIRDHWGWSAVTNRSAALFATVSAEVARHRSAVPVREMRNRFGASDEKSSRGVHE